MSGEHPLQSAFPLVVSRKLYNLAVKEGVDPALGRSRRTRRPLRSARRRPTGAGVRMT